MLVPLVLMARATLARAFVVMMLMRTFTLRSLMIVPVGHLRPTPITMHLAAKRLLGVLALAATTTAAAFGTAVSRRSHGAVSRATATATATASTTTPSAAPATRLAIPVSTIATARRPITATIRSLLTFYASITRATRQRRRRVDGTISLLIRTDGLTGLASIAAPAVEVTRAIGIAIEVTTATLCAISLATVTVTTATLCAIALTAVAVGTISIAAVTVTTATLGATSLTAVAVIAATFSAIAFTAVEVVTIALATTGITAIRIAPIPVPTCLPLALGTSLAPTALCVLGRPIAARPLIPIPVAATTAATAASLRALTAFAAIPIATAISTVSP
jgi:hypothetical protein